MFTKRRKSTVITSALLVYTTLVALYFILFSSESMTTERVLTIVFSYAIIGVLWFVLRRKEKYAAQREKDTTQNNKN